MPLAYDYSYDEDEVCFAIERLRRPGETFEQCEARLERQERERQLSDIAMSEEEL